MENTATNYFVRTAVALLRRLKDEADTVSVMDIEAAKIEADRANGQHPEDTARRLYSVYANGGVKAHAAAAAADPVAADRAWWDGLSINEQKAMVARHAPGMPDYLLHVNGRLSSIRAAHASETGHLPRIQLQGIGRHPARAAGSLLVGDVLVWNYGGLARVERIEDVSPKFVRVVERYGAEEKTYTRRLAKSRLVGFKPVKP